MAAFFKQLIRDESHYLGSILSDGALYQTDFTNLYGLQGDDTLIAADLAVGALSGGSGNDTYEVATAWELMIGDGGGGDDTLYFSQDTYAEALSSMYWFEIDQEHLVFYNLDDIYVTVFDYLTPSSEIEFVQFSDSVPKKMDSLLGELTQSYYAGWYELSEIEELTPEYHKFLHDFLDNYGIEGALYESEYSHYGTIQAMYIAYYGRPADKSGLEYWNQRLIEADGNLYDILQDFGNSDEFRSEYGNLTNEQLMTGLYQQLFSRQPDLSGILFYLNLLNTEQTDLATIAANLYYGAVGGDLNTINNKVIAATYFTHSLDDNKYDKFSYRGEEILDQVKEMMHGIAITDYLSPVVTEYVDPDAEEAEPEPEPDPDAEEVIETTSFNPYEEIISTIDTFLISNADVTNDNDSFTPWSTSEGIKLIGVSDSVDNNLSGDLI
ncbi:MAG: DUF4214 domain-containing protein [Neptuniibacter sp.]